MTAEPILTIAIPTYNRLKYLAQTLERLLPQVNEEWILHIHDNCSDEPVAEALAELIAKFGQGRVCAFRNKANIGGNANIVNCFGHCSTEWIVVIGDDDEIEMDFVANFLAVIEENPDIIYANLSSSIFKREHDFITKGLADFCQNLDNWPNVLFLPCGLYKAQEFVPYLQYGYQYAYTLAPHVALLLQCLKNTNGKCLFSKRLVVTYFLPPGATTWIRFNGNLWAILTELIPDRATQQAFYDRIKKYLMPPTSLASALIDRACQHGGDQRIIFEFRSKCYQCMGRTVKFTLLLGILKIFVRFPHMGKMLVNFNRRLRGSAQPKDNNSGNELV